MVRRRRSFISPLRGWALRASLLFFGVYLLGAIGTPTLIPYLAVLVIVVADAGRLLRR